MPPGQPVSVIPLSLPEFGTEFSWAMCRNTMCDHFGLPYTGEIPPAGSKAAHDTRYRFDAYGRMRCKYCKQSFEIRSNEALRRIARYFLSLSLPFADCPDFHCVNHGHNVFENYIARDSLYGITSRYARAGSQYRVSCANCRQTFSLGEPLRLSVDAKLNQRLTLIIAEVLSQQSVTNILEKLWKLDLSRSATSATRNTTIRPDAYYNHLRSIARRVREYHAWRNARLLDPRAPVERKTPACVYTDVMQVSLKQYGDGPRHQLLNIIVSVLALKRTSFILAAHPAFIPESESIDMLAMLSGIEFNRPWYQDPWDCLLHPGQIDRGNLAKALKEGLPDIARGGYFIRSPYAEAAHFLVVQKMLSRFEKVYYYMDAARELFPSALCALAQPVRDGRVEIALFQHDKVLDTKASRQSFRQYTEQEKKDLLHKAYKQVGTNFRNQVREQGQLSLLPGADRQARAVLFKHAFKGGYSKHGNWAWLRYPPHSRMYRNCRTLWLTGMPHKSFEEHGAPLLFHSTLQPVDSLMNSMRQRTRALQRAAFRARPGRSYLTSYYLPDPVLSELWLYLFHRNYWLRPITDQKSIPAHALGLMTDRQAQSVSRSVVEDKFRDIVLHFRMGLIQATRMSKWHR